MSAPASAKRRQIAAIDVGAGQVEQVVIAALVEREREVAAIIGLGQLLGLDHRAVGAVLDQDARRRFGAEGCRRGSCALRLTPSKWQMA